MDFWRRNYAEVTASDDKAAYIFRNSNAGRTLPGIEIPDNRTDIENKQKR